MTRETHPVDGHIMELRKDVKIPERMPEYGTFEATEAERVPSVYYIPANLTGASKGCAPTASARRHPRKPRG